jgi:uncharacterized membrane protein
VVRVNADLLFGALITVLTAAAIVAFPDWQSPVRIALGLLVVLLIPGYTLVTALFPGNEDLDGIERLALSLGLSIAVVPLIGLALNYTPWGIRLAPIAISLSIFVLSSAALGSYRRLRLSPGLRYVVPLGDPGFRGNVLIVGIVAVIFSGVVALATNFRPEERFSEFYVLGPGGKLEGYPTALTPGESFALRLGVGNHEGMDLQYYIEFPFDPAQGMRTPIITDGEQWETSVTLTAPKGEGRTRLPFDLYRAGDEEPYRSLHLYVTLTAAAVTDPPKDSVFGAQNTISSGGNDDR